MQRPSSASGRRGKATKLTPKSSMTTATGSTPDNNNSSSNGSKSAPAKQVLSFEALQAQIQQQRPQSTQTMDAQKQYNNSPFAQQRPSGNSSSTITLRSASPLQKRIRQQILHGGDRLDGATARPVAQQKKSYTNGSLVGSQRVAPKPIITKQSSTRSVHLEIPPSPERPFPSLSSPNKIILSSARSLSPAPRPVACNNNSKYCNGRNNSFFSVKNTNCLPRTCSTVTATTTSTTKPFSTSSSCSDCKTKTSPTVPVPQSNSSEQKQRSNSAVRTYNTRQFAAKTTNPRTKADSSNQPKHQSVATSNISSSPQRSVTSKVSRLAASSFPCQSKANSTNNGASRVTTTGSKSRTAASAARQPQQHSPAFVAATTTDGTKVAPQQPSPQVTVVPSLRGGSGSTATTVEKAALLRRQRYMAKTKERPALQLAAQHSDTRPVLQQSPAAAASPPPNNSSANGNKSHTASSASAKVSNNTGASRPIQSLPVSGSRAVPNLQLTTQTTSSNTSASKKVTKAVTQRSIRNVLTTQTSKSNPGLGVKTARSPLSPRNTSSVPKRRPTTEKSDQDSGPSTRRNLDKKSVRLKYGADFANEIDRYMAGIHSMTSPLAAALTPKNVGKKTTSCLNVYVRKRPIFASHLENGDFDVVQIVSNGDDNEGITTNKNAFAKAGEATSAVLVYKTSMAADMRTKMVQPIVFSECITAAFDDQTGSNTVYRTAVQPLVQSALQRGKASTLLMFGQTGSGKTYTMSACLKLVAAELFASRAVKQVEVQCLELAGKQCRDLMQSGGDATSEVRIQDNTNGSVTFVGASKSLIDSPRQLVFVFEDCQNRRATQSTEQNDVSSRSHAVFQLRLPDAGGGVLRLFDCAGTERRHDSLMHSKERQMESKEINESLYAFKECIRARTNNSKTQQNAVVPYRSSNLTRILRESLESEDISLAVIGCIAPEATATEHTIQTMKTLCDLTGTTFHEGKTEKLPSGLNCTEPTVPPQKWDYAGLVRWLSDQSLLGNSPAPSHLNGKLIMRMNRMQLRNALYDNESTTGGRSASDVGMEKAAKLFDCLREESGRVGRLELQRRMGHQTIS